MSEMIRQKNKKDKRRPPPNCQEANSRPPIHFAVAGGHLKMLMSDIRHKNKRNLCASVLLSEIIRHKNKKTKEFM